MNLIERSGIKNIKSRIIFQPTETKKKSIKNQRITNSTIVPKKKTDRTKN